MRPIALHIEGFGVFRDPVEIDFEGVDYFALVGPTGSGKSTVMDAMCFALYGSVPRYGDERLVGRAVSTGKQEATVSLTFAIGDGVYRATRITRVGAGKKSDALLEHVDRGDGLESEVLAKRPSEMKPAVEHLLGLPFQHFIKCVLLPQGDFAKFLHDDPARRQDLLSRLLDLQVYERIGQHAREQAAAAKGAIELHEQQLGELAYATDESRHTAELRRNNLRALYDTLDAARPEDERLGRAIAEAESSARRASEIAGELKTVAAPTDLADLTTALDQARTVRRVANDALAAARAELDAATARAESLGDPTPLVRARDAHVAIATIRAQAGLLVDALTDATSAHERTLEAAGTAEETLHDAEATLVAARGAHAAHALAATLVAGEPCPVCAQTVARVPKRSRATALTGPERAVMAARKATQARRNDLTKAAALQAAAAERVQQLTAQLAAHEAAVAEQPDLETIDRLLADIETARTALAETRRREQEARAAAQVAADLEQRADEQTGNVRRALTQVRDALLRRGLDVPEVADDLAAAWVELADFAAAAHTEHESIANTERNRADALRQSRASVFAGVIERARALAIPDRARDLAALRELVVEHGTEARNALTRIEEAIDAADKLREARAAAKVEQEVADLVGTELRADRFEKWLLTEATEVLVESASRTLLSLSDGQYSLRYSAEGEFVVVDHRDADMTRSVRTLSGGETFQASLALALALSDQLASLSAGGSAKLDAIFLDEGFGALDAETLETVAGTIEALGTSGRMVGLVTHVPALAERVPVRYRVRRTDRAATVTREDG